MTKILITFKAEEALIQDFDRLVAAGNRSHCIREMMAQAVDRAKRQQEARNEAAHQ